MTNCSRDNRNIRFKEGTCIQEMSKQYASFADNRGTIFKITEIKGSDVALEQWYNSGWYNLKSKPRSYFNEKKDFYYIETTCPDFVDNRRSIKDTVKAIKFSN